MKILTEAQLKEILEQYIEFCKEASITFNMRADSLGDFLGWLKYNIDEELKKIAESSEVNE